MGIRQYFDCPMCGKKQGAYRSETYPESVVHKCDGKILIEVALYRNGKLLDSKSGKMSSGTHPKQFYSSHFLIKQVTDIDELVGYGQKLNNNTSDRSSASAYLNNKNKAIYVAKDRISGQVEYMILTESKSIPGIPFFSGKNITEIPRIDGEEILKVLIKEGVIDRNPFPNKYHT